MGLFLPFPGAQRRKVEMMMDIHELARELRLSESGIYQMVSQKRIPFVRIGRSLRFDTDEIKKWIESKKVTPKN